MKYEHQVTILQERDDSCAPPVQCADKLGTTHDCANNNKPTWYVLMNECMYVYYIQCKYIERKYV